MNALDVLCAQLTRDLFAIAKFLLGVCMDKDRSNLARFLQYIPLGCMKLQLLLHCLFT